MVTYLNDTYNMMMTMMIRMLMIIMMMKIKYSHNSANFEATISIFSMVIDINDTYRSFGNQAY